MGKREINTKESIRVVTSNNFLRASGLENISLKARKLLYLAIAQCEKNDSEFFEYTITATDFAKFMDVDISNVYREADKITDELMKGFIKYIPDGTKSFHKFQLFKRCDYEHDEGLLTFEMSSDMSPILLNLKKDFTQPLLDDFAHMRSNYSIEIWHLMQREMHSRKAGLLDSITFTISLEELRRITGTQKKFVRLSQFKVKVLDRATTEIEKNCGMVVTYTDIKKGRAVIGFQFSVVSAWHADPSEIRPETRRRGEQIQAQRSQKR